MCHSLVSPAQGSDGAKLVPSSFSPRRRRDEGGLYMRKSVLLAASAALMTVTLSHVAFAVPNLNGAALRTAAETTLPVETTGYGYRRGYGGYGYRYGDYTGGYGYNDRGHRGYGY